MRPDIAVLVPCYNEGQTVGKVVRDFKEALPEATIYVYDNNSTDNTAQEAEAAGAVVRKEPQQGKGRQDDVVPAALPAEGSTDVTLDRIRNSMNPYVMFYRTAVTIVDETAPNQFAGQLDRYGRYTGIPVLSDMLLK